MIGYNINSDMPAIAVAVGCSSTISLDFSGYDFADGDKIIFSFKNSTLKSASSVFAAVISQADLDEDHCIDITIESDVADMLTEKSFYTFTVESADGSHKKITDNGRIILQYGAYGDTENSDDGSNSELSAEDLKAFLW